MVNQKVKIPTTLYRSYQVRKESIDQEKRTVDLSFSSDHPVRRSLTTGEAYDEILDHNPASVLLERLNRAGPFLMHHDPTRQVGKVVPGSAHVGLDDDNRRVGRCKVKFSRSKEGQEVFDDYCDGIRGTVSVGYQIHDMDEDEDDADSDEQEIDHGKPVRKLRATRWEPMEISDESLPADPTVGAGRSNPESETEITVKTKTKPQGVTAMIITRNLSPSATAGGGTATLTPEQQEAAFNQRMLDAQKADKLRRGELLKLSKTYSNRGYDFTQDVLTFIDEDKTVEDFTRHILEKRSNTMPISGSPIASPLGMNSREIGQYSLCKAIRELDTRSGGRGLTGLEKEANEAAIKSRGFDLESPNRFVIPEDVIRTPWGRSNRAPHTRDMVAGVFAQGGALIETEVLGASLIELLRNKMQCVNAGARTMAGLRGNVAIPRQTAGATAYWLPEVTSITESDQTLNQLMLTPHRLAAMTYYSNLLLAQSTIDAESFVRADLMKQLAIAKDLAALSGNGGSQPIGILNTTGVGVQTVTSGTPTWVQMVDFESTVALANADFGKLAWQFSTAARGLLKTTLKVAGSNFPIYIWEGGGRAEEGIVNGYRALATNQLDTALNSDKCIFGNWEDLIFADWEGWEVLVDPYTKSDTGEVRITIYNFTDIGIRHNGSFCVSNGSVI